MAETLVFNLDVRDRATAAIQRLGGAVNNASQSTGNLRGAVGGLIESIKGLGPAGVAGVAVAGLGAAFGAVSAMALKTADAMSETWESAMKLGTSTEFLSGMQHIFGLAGVEAEKLQSSITKLNLATAKGSPAFEQMGISLKNANGEAKTTEQLFLDVADQFAGMEDGAQKASMAVTLFGKSGTDLIPLLNQGSDGLKAQTDRAKELGLVYDDLAGAKADQLMGAMEDLTSAGKGLFMQAGAAAQEDLVPVLEYITELFEGWGPILGGITKAISAAFRYMLGGANAAAGAFVDIFASVTEFADGFLSGILEQVNRLRLALGKDPIKVTFLADVSSGLRGSAEALYGDALKLFADREDPASTGRTKLAGVVTDGGKKAKSGKSQAQKEAEDAVAFAIEMENKANEERIKAYEKQRVQIEEQEAFKTETYLNGLAFRAQAEQDESIRLELQRQADLEKMRVDFEEKRLKAEELGLSQVALLEQQKLATMAINQEIDSQKNALHEAELERIAQEKEARLSTFGAITSGLKGLFAKSKAMAIADAIMQGAVAVNRAWASYPYPFNLAIAGITAANTGAQIAQIKSQRMALGGMIDGSNRLILANENGQESIINARGTRALGREGVNALNEGRFSDLVNSLGRSVKGATQGLTINISGGMVDKRFVERELLPLINTSLRRV